MRAEVKEAIRKMAVAEEGVDVTQVDKFRMMLAVKLRMQRFDQYRSSAYQRLAGCIEITETGAVYDKEELEALAEALASLLYKRFMYLHQVFDDPIREVFLLNRPKFVL